jgi:hypothetical protein
MEFPITRQRLRNYKANEAAAAFTKQWVQGELAKICSDIEQKVLNTDERKYVYYNSGGKMIKELLVAVKNNFLDCNIGTDPKETYILIDWS